ncbi:MAG TPA: MFS transporter [Capsulimonadaceae bacterium]|jgi:ACS family hexuronate transporter-like MFS transporter
METPVIDVAATTSAETPHIGNYRWRICALLFFATTINYIDRLVLALLAPTLQSSLHWSDIEYGNIVTAFQGAYALGLLLLGNLIDRIGTRKGYALSVVLWSIAGAAHALVRSAFGFGMARVALGLGEAGNFPAAVKTIAEWFPKKERALATGIFNAGSNIGAIIVPLTVPWITLRFGWPTAFVVAGLIGFVWLIFWLRMYRAPQDHPQVGASELAYIRSEPETPSERIPWAKLLPHKQTWAFALGKFLTDPAWWIYLSWLPKFLHTKYGITLDHLGPPLVVIYVMADVGSIGGGWLSSIFLNRGIKQGRLLAMLVCALLVVPVMAVGVSSLWVAVILIGLAAAAHQGFSANLYTMVSDTFPKAAVGSVVGIGSMAGSVAGMFAASAVGYILQAMHENYTPIFIYAGFAYLVALGVIRAINPRLEPAKLTGETAIDVG